jgi:hypothetical protein
MLSSLPPDVEVPLPLGEEVEPVVWGGAALGLEVLAAGSPVIDPLPLGLPCAETPEAVTVKTTNTTTNDFMLSLPATLRRGDQFVSHDDDDRIATHELPYTETCEAKFEHGVSDQRGNVDWQHENAFSIPKDNNVSQPQFQTCAHPDLRRACRRYFARAADGPHPSGTPRIWNAYNDPKLPNTKQLSASLKRLRATSSGSSWARGLPGKKTELG